MIDDVDMKIEIITFLHCHLHNRN